MERQFGFFLWKLNWGDYLIQTKHNLFYRWNPLHVYYSGSSVRSFHASSNQIARSLHSWAKPIWPFEYERWREDCSKLSLLSWCLSIMQKMSLHNQKGRVVALAPQKHLRRGIRSCLRRKRIVVWRILMWPIAICFDLVVHIIWLRNLNWDEPFVAKNIHQRFSNRTIRTCIVFNSFEQYKAWEEFIMSSFHHLSVYMRTRSAFNNPSRWNIEAIRKFCIFTTRSKHFSWLLWIV